MGPMRNSRAAPSTAGRTRSCPHCKATILESSAICPQCRHHLKFGATDDGLEGDADLHRARQVGVVEPVGVAQPLAGHEFQVFATEAVRMPGAEVGERHAVGAADAGVDVVHLGGEAIGRQPAAQGGGLGEGAKHALRRGLEDAVQANGSGGHG